MPRGRDNTLHLVTVPLLRIRLRRAIVPVRIRKGIVQIAVEGTYMQVIVAVAVE